MINIFGSFWATLAAYLAGVCLVLTVGMQFCHLIEFVSIKAEHYIGHTEPPPLISLEELAAKEGNAEAVKEENSEDAKEEKIEEKEEK